MPTGELSEVRARWVLGADGANSLVREALGIPRRDLGFQEHWLVVDVAPGDADVLDLPDACQWCDPRRPTTQVHSGTGHRRWEFMLLDGERPEDFDEARSWELLAPWSPPRTPRCCATRSTSSARWSPSGARGALPDRGRRRAPDPARSSGRACARGFGTRRTSPGSSTSCCADWLMRACLTR